MRRDDDGYASVLVVGFTLVALGVCALAIDGTRAFLYRRSLQNAADGAALAGASEIDRETYYRSGGREVTLDPPAAHATAREWLSMRSLPISAEVIVQEDAVRVVVRDDLETTFLRMIGMDRIRVGAESVARPLAGD